MYNGLWVRFAGLFSPLSVIANGMGIRFYCPNGHKLHVKSFLAGKRGICPHCDARFSIPLESRIPAKSPRLSPRDQDGFDWTHHAELAVASAAAASSGPAGSAAVMDTPAPGEPLWYVRPPSGGEYGPARDELFRNWIEEGRVGSDSLVWREGWPDWRDAAAVFPELAPAMEPAARPHDRQAASPSEPRRRAQAKKKSIAAVLVFTTIALLAVLVVVLQTR